MKHILNFKQLFESTSAASQERAGWDYPPFKYAQNFDPRLGYSKKDFCTDLVGIYQKMTATKRKELMNVLFQYGGILRISEIENLTNDKVDELMKEVEILLNSHAAPELDILPDGYILCFEDMSYNGRRCDIYYSPEEKMIRITFTDEYPEVEEKTIPLEGFKPAAYKIGDDDFQNTVAKCDNNSPADPLEDIKI